MKKIILLIIMIILMTVIISGCHNNVQKSVILIEVEPKSFPLRLLYETTMEISLTNLTDTIIYIPDFVPVIYFYDDRNWVELPEPARLLILFPEEIEPGETLIGYFSFQALKLNNYPYRFTQGKYRFKFEGRYGEVRDKGIWHGNFRIT